MSTGFEFEMDLDGEDIDRDGKFGILAEGSYHLILKELIEHSEKSNDMQAKFEVLAGKNVAEIGKVHYEFLGYPEPGLSEKANSVRKSQIRNLFYALKLTTPEEVKQLQEARKPLRIDLQMAIGRTCCGKITHEHYESRASEKKVKAKLGFDLWSIDNPKAAGIPLANIDSSGGGTAFGASTGDGLDDLA